MRKKDDEQKEPIEMTTDEALDYVFHPEIAKALRTEAAKNNQPDEECKTEDSEAD